MFEKYIQKNIIYIFEIRYIVLLKGLNPFLVKQIHFIVPIRDSASPVRRSTFDTLSVYIQILSHSFEAP